MTLAIRKLPRAKKLRKPIVRGYYLCPARKRCSMRLCPHKRFHLLRAEQPCVSTPCPYIPMAEAHISCELAGRWTPDQMKEKA